MAAIEILKGPKAGKQLTLDTVNKCLKEGLYMVNRYPISEISQVEEIVLDVNYLGRSATITMAD